MKSPISSPPARAARGPPKPKICASGTRRQQFGGERAGVQIAGRLAARNHDAQATDGRTNRLSGTASLNVTLVMVRLITGCRSAAAALERNPDAVPRR